MFRSLILCGCLAFVATGLVAQETQEVQETPTPTVKHDLKAAGKNVGRAARKVGHKVKRGAKDVGRAVKKTVDPD